MFLLTQVSVVCDSVNISGQGSTVHFPVLENRLSSSMRVSSSSAKGLRKSKKCVIKTCKSELSPKGKFVISKIRLTGSVKTKKLSESNNKPWQRRSER